MIGLSRTASQKKVRPAPTTLVGRLGEVVITMTRSNGQLSAFQVQNPTARTVQVQIEAENFTVNAGQTISLPLTPAAWVHRYEDHYQSGQIVGDGTSLNWSVR